MHKAALRIARLSDASALAEIYAPYVKDTTISFEWTAPSAEEFRERMRQILAEYPYLVYEENGEVLGYAYAHRAFERYSYRFCAELSVYIRTDARQRGIGELLYRSLIELCRAMRVQTLYGVVTNPNEPSFRLHERLGFERVGHFPRAGQKFGRWIDVVWYGLVIGDMSDDPAEVIPFPSLDGRDIEKVFEQQMMLFHQNQRRQRNDI